MFFAFDGTVHHAEIIWRAARHSASGTRRRSIADPSYNAEEHAGWLWTTRASCDGNDDLDPEAVSWGWGDHSPWSLSPLSVPRTSRRIDRGGYTVQAVSGGWGDHVLTVAFSPPSIPRLGGRPDDGGCTVLAVCGGWCAQFRTLALSPPSLRIC